MIQRFQLCIIVSGIILISACSHISHQNINEQASSETTNIISSYDLSDQYHQMTTHPGIDIMPSLSSDQEWLAFTSKRSGNFDIWVKRVTGGKAIRVTDHKADDLYPVWCPTGRYLYFVSCREDAAGDIWRAAIAYVSQDEMILGKPTRITEYLGADESPSISPNGQMIAYTSDQDGSRNIWIYDIRRKRNFQLTQKGGVNPTWSPDSRRICYSSIRTDGQSGGHLFLIDVPEHYSDASRSDHSEIVEYQITFGASIDALPNWSPFGDEVIFTRYAMDTNNDTHIDPNDRPTICKIILDNTRTMQLVPADKNAYFPCWGRDNRIYYVSEIAGNYDIWSLSENGPIPKQENIFLQYQFAESFFPLESDLSLFDTTRVDNDPTQLYARLLAFSRIYEYFQEDEIWTNYALLEIVKTYYALNQNQLAESYKNLLLSKGELQSDIRGSLTLVSLKAALAQNRDDRARIEGYLRDLYEESNDYFGDEETTLKFDMAIAELFTHLGDRINAIQLYENIINQYPHQRVFTAQSQIRVADNYHGIGTIDEVINRYVRVIKDYPEQTKCVDLAIKKVVELLRDDDYTRTIQNYREIIDKFPQIKKLGAQLKLEIANSFVGQGELDAAEREINELSILSSDEAEELAESEMLLADIYRLRNDDLKAINILKSVADKYSDIRSGFYVIRAKEKLLDLYLTSARRLRNDGDYALALTRYRGAINIQFSTIEAHRGQVFILSQVGQVDNAINYYTMLYEQHPNDEIIEYVLGLCYSYKATERSEQSKDISKLDVSMLKNSNQLIENALSRNYQLIHAYLTLSYNYEINEQYDAYNATREKTFAEKVSNTLSAPIVALFRLITFQHPRSPERWYERAIEVLTTGISLNDEELDPQLESELALNLAQNYYNLEEFGFEKAYEFYHRKMKYDTTFASLENKAEVFKRMGHCALVVEDESRGPIYLKKTIQLYTTLNNEQQVLINVKRLALLYQLTGSYEEAIEYYMRGIEIESAHALWNEVQKSYRSVAYNYQLLNDEEMAIRYATLSAELLSSDKINEVRKEPNWIKLGILGLEFPVFNIGALGSGESTAIEGFTTEEETALTYSILAEAYRMQKNYTKAIEYYEKKLAIYRKDQDKVAESIFLNNIAFLYYLKQDYDAARNYFEASYVVAKRENLISGIIYNAINLGSIGVIRLKNGLILEDDIKSKGYVEAALNYYTDKTIGLEREKSQLLIMLGNIIYYANRINEKSDRERKPEDAEDAIVQFQELLNSVSSAFEYFNEARELAKAKKYYLELILVDINLAQLYSDVHESDHALENLKEARINAIRHEYDSQIWLIDHMIARIIEHVDDEELKRLGLSKNAAFYYTEGIDLLEANSARSTYSPLTPIYLNDVESLYKDAIKYYLKIDPEHAFTLTERMRAQRYLDIISSYKLELKKERHKNYIGLARDDNRRIMEVESQIRQELTLDNYSPVTVRRLHDQKQAFIDDYKELLQEMNAEDPELESMVYVNPNLLETIRRRLPHSTIIFTYCIIDDSLYVWSFDKLSSTFLYRTEFNLNFYLSNIVDSTDNYIISTQDSLNYGYLFQKLIAPISSLIDEHNNIVIIPDDDLFLIPFHSLLYITDNDVRGNQSVVIAPSISSYYFSLEKRNIRGSNVLFTEESNLRDVFEDNGFSIVTLQQEEKLTGSALKDKFEYSDILHLDVDMKWDRVDPLLSRADIASIGSLETKDFFSYNLKSYLIIYNSDLRLGSPDENNLIGFNRAALYAGTPTILYSLWPVEKSKRIKFYDSFYRYLVDLPPGQALSRAKQSMISEGESFEDWGGYQLFGYQGMTGEEEEQYALEQLEDRVRMGYISLEEGDYDEAIHDYEQALKMARTLNSDRYAGILRDQLIEASALSGNFQKAIDYQQQILEEALWEENIDGILQSRRFLAIFYTEQGDYDKALSQQQTYIDLLKQNGRAASLGEAYLKLGLIFERLTMYQDVLTSFENAKDNYDRFEDKAGIAETMSQSGRVNLLYIDNYISALEAYMVALSLYSALDDKINIIRTNHNIGLAYEKIGDYRSAHQYLMQAYERSLVSEDPALIAISQQFLANVSWKMGEYDAALKYQEAALGEFDARDDHKYRIIGNSTKGLIMMSLGQIDDALKSENLALALSRRYNEMSDEATIQKNIGLIYSSTGEYHLARDAFKESLRIDRQLNSARGIAYDHRDFGVLFNNMGIPDSALYHLRKALVISQEINDRRNEAHCNYEIGRAYNLMSEYKTAIDTLLIAQKISEHLIISEIEWRTLWELALANKGLGNIPQSSHYFEGAIEVVEQMRSKIKLEQFQSGFIDDKVEVYGDYIKLLIENGDDGKAFEIVERSRSRSFLDLLVNKDITFSSSEMTGVYYEVRDIELRLKRLEAKLSHLRSQKEIQSDMVQLEATLQDSLAMYTKIYTARIEQLDRGSAELADLAHVRTVAASDIQKLLFGKTALIEYFKVKDQLFIWTITRHSVSAHLIDFSAVHLDNLVENFRISIDQRTSITEQAKHLYGLLFAPIEEDLNEVGNIIIIPHGVLHYLPFAALIDRTGLYLMDKYSISLSPSASVLAFCSKKGDRYNKEGISDFSILALGNPDLNSAAYDLPFAEKEIESIKFDYDDVISFLNEDANEYMVRTKATSADMIVFSCHGEFDPLDPLKSRLLLAKYDDYDGNLEAREIFGIDMSSYLISMSACETGLSAIHGGDEVIGLNRSLIFAGATSLLSSLWKVDDLATAVLIKRFFRNLKNTEINKAEALRQAQLIVRREINDHPAYWASFYLTGDFR